METLAENLEEKVEKSQGTVRYAIRAVGLHMWALRGKGWLIHN